MLSFLSAVGPWGFLFDHTLVGLAVFAGVCLAAILLLSGDNPGEAIRGIFRIFLTIFTSPFVFLRDAMTTVRAAEYAEQDYKRTRVFMLFRLSRIQYFLLLLLCLLTLSGGVTTAVFAFYPQAELEQSKALTEEISNLETQIDAANQIAQQHAGETSRDELEQRRSEARSAYLNQVQSNRVFQQSTRFNGSIITQLESAGSIPEIESLRDNIPNYMNGCPSSGNWRGFSVADCGQFRDLLTELAARRISEFNLQRSADEAETAYEQSDNSAGDAQARVQSLSAQLDGAKQQLDQVSLLNGQWVINHGGAALAVLLGTLWSIITVVWLGAIFIDVLNWLILMMRSLERTQQAKLESGRERSSQSSDWRPS